MQTNYPELLLSVLTDEFEQKSHVNTVGCAKTLKKLEFDWAVI